MSSVNKAIIVGNLGNDPELKYMPSGDAVCNISVATSSRWKDKQSGEQKERTEWHRVSMFGRLAEIAGEYLRKGSKVYIEGELQTREYEKDGIKRYSTEIKAREMKMLSPKNQNGGSGGSGAGGGAQAAGDGSAPPQPGPDDFDDDIPF